MRTLASASVVCLSILAGAQGGDRAALKKEVDLLRGTWSVLIGDVKVQFAIYGDESFELNFGGARLNGARTIDPARNQSKSP
jgi:hypothetical protein